MKLRMGMVLAVSWLILVGAAEKPPQAFLRFHIQAPPGVRDPQLVVPVQLKDPPSVILAYKQPALTEADVASLDMIDANQLLVTFNPVGKEKLELLTGSNIGAVLVVIMNNRVVYAPMIDMVLMSGRFLIPEGVTQADVNAVLAVMAQNRGF